MVNVVVKTDTLLRLFGLKTFTVSQTFFVAKYKSNEGSGSSTVAKHWPHHDKVKGLCPPLSPTPNLIKKSHL